MHKNLGKLNELDMIILKEIDDKILDDAINFFIDYREVRWRADDKNKTYTLKEVREMKPKYQPLPIYPNALERIGSYFYELRFAHSSLFKKYQIKQKTSRSYFNLGTVLAPSVIVYFISDAYYRDCFCDGLLGSGVENNIYLKMLLHLQDCKSFIKLNK